MSTEVTSGPQAIKGAGVRRVRMAAAGIAVASPIASHFALAMGQGYGAAVALAAVQGAATGVLVGGVLPRHRWAGGLVCLMLWAALLLGARHGAPAALLAQAGVAHALVYSALLALFGRSLRTGGVALVTWLAQRINPHFLPEQVPYTRAVTWGWVVVFALELGANLMLLVIAPTRWAGFVTTWHAILPAGYLITEVAVRQWRWRHAHATGLVDTIRGARALMRRQGDATASTTRQ